MSGNLISYENLPKGIRDLYQQKLTNLLPLKRGSKKPSMNNWKRYQSNLVPYSQLKSHKGNFGIILGDPLKSGLGYLTVLDIDDEEGEKGIFRLFKDLNTLIVKTPSKEFHIYFVSEKPVEHKDKLAKLYGCEFELRGKSGLYVVLPPSTITLKNGHDGHHKVINKGRGPVYGIKLVDDVEDLVSQILEEGGYQPVEGSNEHKPEYDNPNGWPRELDPEEISSISKHIEPINKEGVRHNLALYTAGWLKKAEVNESSAVNVIKAIFKNDEELNDRINAVKTTYELEIKPKGSSGIENLMLDHYRSKEAVKSIMEKLEKIIVHPDSIISIRKIIYGLNKSSLITLTKKRLAQWLQKRYYILRDNLTGDLYLYDDVELYYKNLSDLDFHEFFSGLFPEETFLIRETNDIISAISRRGDESPKYIAFTNGWMDVSSGEFVEPKPSHFVKFHIPYKYNSRAASLNMEKFLHEVFNDDDSTPKLLGFLEFLGYTIMERRNPYHKLLIMYGDPGTGKSTIINVLEAIFENSMSSVALHDMVERFGLESTVGKRVNLTYDLSAKSIHDLGKIKAITGEDPITIDRKFKTAITVREHPKIIGTANNLPRITDDTKPFFERLILIELTNKFRNTDKNKPGLAHELINDGDAIEYLIKEAVNAYIELKETNIWSMALHPDEIENEYLKSSNPSLYVANQIFEYTGDENDFISTEEANELIIECLKIFDLLIPADKRKFSWALASLGASKVRRRVDGELSWGYSSIKIKKSNKGIKHGTIEFQTQIINMGDTNTAELYR